jgi:hypothetical protein
MSAKLLGFSPNPPLHFNAGEILSPSQENFFGIIPSSTKAGLVNLMDVKSRGAAFVGGGGVVGVQAAIKAIDMNTRIDNGMRLNILRL